MAWCTIESDPAVFSELISEFGVSGVQVEEVYSLDQHSMRTLGTVYGLVFLFKWHGEKDERPYLPAEQKKVFFASQVIQNACATQAILSILLNRRDIELGDELTNLKAFTKEFPPELKGLAIANAEAIRKAHNSFARPDPFVPEEGRKGEKSDDDLYHFISYVPVVSAPLSTLRAQRDNPIPSPSPHTQPPTRHQDGYLYELDGLKPGPLQLGECTEENWLDVVTPMIQHRIEQHSSKEIRFNLMAVVADRRVQLCQQQTAIEKERNMTVGKLQARGGKMPTTAELQRLVMEHPEPPPTGEVAVDERSVEELMIALAHTTNRSSQLQHELDIENQKAQQWKIENGRRKHNYVPFIVSFLKVDWPRRPNPPVASNLAGPMARGSTVARFCLEQILAERGELLPYLESAKKRKSSR
ncbi:MAG: hypothetical protein SGPRY_001855 [Prymnesium sp.]